LKKGGACVAPELDDVGEWGAMFEAMSGVGIGNEERNALLKVVAFVTLLGEVTFDGDEKAVVVSGDLLGRLAALFGIDEAGLGTALTTNTIIANDEAVPNTLDSRQAVYARDALAKAIFDRAFSWLVGRLNQALTECGKDAKNARSTVMGLLDIYGFEILSTNGFEQVCINYCNEKLQQVFIELTLKSEQEEYKREGIEWVPVEFFNNAIICDMIESLKEPHGMVPLLDDCCLGPGDMTDVDFLAVLDKVWGAAVTLRCEYAMLDTLSCSN
jgi:myosin-1